NTASESSPDIGSPASDEARPGAWHCVCLYPEHAQSDARAPDSDLPEKPLDWTRPKTAWDQYPRVNRPYPETAPRPGNRSYAAGNRPDTDDAPARAAAAGLAAPTNCPGWG